MFLRSLRRVCLTPDNEDRKHLQINQQTDRNKSSPQGTAVHILSDFQPFVLSLVHVHHSQEFLVHILCVNQTPCFLLEHQYTRLTLLLWTTEKSFNLCACLHPEEDDAFQFNPDWKFYHQRAAFYQQVCVLLFFFFLTFITSSDPPSPQDLLFPAFHCRYEYNLITHVVHSRLHRFNLNHCSTLWYKLVSHQMTAQTCFTFKITHRYFGH